MKRRISILAVLVMLLTAFGVGVNVSADGMFQNFLTVDGDTVWTNTNSAGEVTAADGVLTITTGDQSDTGKAIGAYCTAGVMMPVYTAQYDVALNYDNMPEAESGYIAVQLFDGAYRALISVYKDSINAQDASSTVKVPCTVESGKQYTLTVIVNNGVMQLYKKEAGTQGFGEKLISDMAMRTNTGNVGRFYAYTQGAKNITAQIKNVKIDSWSESIPSMQYTTQSVYNESFTENGEWAFTQSRDGNVSIADGLLKLCANGVTTAQYAAYKLNECDYPAVNVSYKINANTSGKVFLRFEDIGYRAFIQIRNADMLFCSATATNGATRKVSSAAGVQYDLRLEINSVEHTYSLLRKFGNNGYMYIIKDQPMQPQTTASKKLVIGIESDASLDVQISGLSVDYRGFGVAERVYANAMDSADKMSDWIVSGEEGLLFEDGCGVTFTSDGGTYKPSIQKNGIADGVPTEIKFNYTLEEASDNGAFLGVQVWNGINSRGFIQINPNQVRIMGTAWTNYTNFDSVAGKTYTFKIVVGETAYSVYRKAFGDSEFKAIAENVIMQTGHSVKTQNIKFYMEKRGAAMTISDFTVSSVKEYYIDSVNTADGIQVKYICQKKDAEGAKVYVAVYNGDELELKDVYVSDASTVFGVNNELLYDVPLEDDSLVRAFIWRDMAPVSTSK